MYVGFTIERNIEYSVPDNQVLVSFGRDCEAEAFSDWLTSNGSLAFQDWYQQHERSYR